MRIEGVASVEVTFEDGSVKHFKVKSGDNIVMSSFPTTIPPYYTLLIAPVDFSQKDKI